MISAFGGFLWRVIAFVSGHPFGESVSVDAQHHGGIGEVLLVFGERLLDVELFEFAERLVQKDVAFEHFVDEAFESGVNQSAFPVNNL